MHIGGLSGEHPGSSTWFRVECFPLAGGSHSPLVVLNTAYVPKGQIVEAIEQRHATKHAYQPALADWQILTAELEQLPGWSQFYANALQDALRKANARRKETLVAMTQADGRLAIYQEMQLDRLYAEPDARPESNAVVISNLSVLRCNGNGTSQK